MCVIASATFLEERLVRLNSLNEDKRGFQPNHASDDLILN